MASDQPRKQRSHHADRMTLDEQAFRRIEKWSDQLREHLKGSRFTKNDMVNEIIKRHPEELTAIEVREIGKAYFDPARTLLWAAKQVKEAQKEGRELNLAELIDGAVLRQHNPRVSSKKKLAKPTTMETSPSQDSM